jgi:flagellar biosynthesis protein FlhA
VLAINPGGATQQLPGTKTTDPAFGLPAVWIDERHREMAQMAGFTVVDCATVVATHLSHLMQVNAARLLGRVETQHLVEHVTKLAPKLIEDVVPKMVGIATLQRVLQLLLEEGVHIRDMRSIVECLAEHAATVTDPAELARRIRVHLAPAIVQQIYGHGEGARRHRAGPRARAPGHPGPDQPARRGARPRRGRHAHAQRRRHRRRQEDLGLPACLLVPDLIRAPMARLLKRAAPRLKVLGHSEIPETHSIRIGRSLAIIPELGNLDRMNVKRFTARTSREALALVRQAFGDDAVVMSTRPCAEGVEVLAMAPESMQQLERVRATAEPVRAARPAPPGWQRQRRRARPRQRGAAA